jgi:LETM1 and EF-hand domain-containing protein 1
MAPLGIVLDDDTQKILGQGKDLKDSRPRKEDIVEQ